MEQNWRDTRTDNYQSDSDPCTTCKYYRKSNVGGGGAVWGILFVLTLIGAFILFMNWQDDKERLRNCIYYDNYSGTVHSVKDGVDSTLFDSDYLEEFNRLFDSSDNNDFNRGMSFGYSLDDVDD